MSHALSLPTPISPSDTNEVLLTLISTYLGHSLIATSYATFNTGEPQPLQVETLCTALYSTGTLLQWLPHLSGLSSKHVDSLLTRAYIALTKSSINIHAVDTHTSTVVYRIRVYGLLCLARTSPGVLESATFWNQAAKFTTSFIKDVDRSDDGETMLQVSATVLDAFAELIEHARHRDDSSKFMGGRGFIAFCEYWASFAKRVS